MFLSIFIDLPSNLSENFRWIGMLSINIIYFISLTVIFGYSLLQAYLLFRYKFSSKNKDLEFKDENWPNVTIQAPVFNETTVIERLIRSLVAIDYPKEKLQIQILDDSTDETTDIAKEVIANIQSESSIDIQIVRRKNRQGYKAGALRDAMDEVKGEYVAIFDADFIPEPDFLIKTLPYFENDRIGMVQTRWGHLNKSKMMLTELQAFGLNGHFAIEQKGRNTSGHFINFNGTGGVWRKSCIEDAGGWNSDTLTEDLDLSYRAQMKGWDFKYLEDVESPAELPETMLALKNQQHRWMKGGAECLLKNSRSLLSHPKVSVANKFNGILHLFNSSVFLFIFLLAFFSVPIVIFRANSPEINKLYHFETLFFASTVILYFYYYFSYRDKKNNLLVDIVLFTLRFFQFLTVSLGLSFNNAKAVFEAYLGKKSGFVRTPKFNGGKIVSKIADYPKRKIQMWIEIGLFTYFLIGLIYGVLYNVYGLIPFQIMLVLGYGYVSCQTIFDILAMNKIEKHQLATKLNPV